MESKETYESRALVKETYESPALVEVGGFAEKTMGTCCRTPEGRPGTWHGDTVS